MRLGNYQIRAGFVGYKLSKPKTIKIKPGDSIVLNFRIKYANEVLID